ncbi:MAG: aminotransferase class I/II-fold pyridoxal phosphate-dependent enzyme [Sporolactobacillus sp.]
MTDFPSAQLLRRMPNNFFTKMDQLVDDYAAKGIDLIRLQTGSPDQRTPEPIVRALVHAASLPANQGYPPCGGKKSLKKAIAAFYRRTYGVELDPDTEVTIFAGATIAISALPHVLLNPGDVMLTADPGYPMYFICPLLARATVYGIPVSPADDFLPNYQTIPSDILKKARMLMLNYPNNPTGAVATEHFFADTVAFSKTNNIPVVHDFAYAAFGFDGRTPLSYLQTPGAKAQGIEIGTFSKTYNMAGWRLGFAAGNRSLIQALSRYHDLAHSDVFGAVQDAGVQALLGSQAPVRQLNDLYAKRRRVLISGLHAIGWDVPAPRGSFFCWFPVPSGYTSESFAHELLEKAHVAVAPGNGFGPHGEGFVRCGLLESEERLREAIRRIESSGVLQPKAGKTKA